MRNLFFLLCFGALLCSCAGSPNGNSTSEISQTSDKDKTVIELKTSDENKTVIELIKEISLLYDEHSESYRKLEQELWDEGRSRKDVNDFVDNRNTLVGKRNSKIYEKLITLKGREIPISVVSDSLFEITGGKIRNCALEANEVYLKMVFFVKLKKDFIPYFHYNSITKEYYAPHIPSLEIKLLNSQGTAMGFRMSRFLFNVVKAKNEAVHGEVYAHAGYECNEMDLGISFTLNIGPTVNNNYKELSSIEAVISQ